MVRPNSALLFVTIRRAVFHIVTYIRTCLKSGGAGTAGPSKTRNLADHGHEVAVIGKKKFLEGQSPSKPPFSNSL
jgi:hypothetical protein